MPKIFLSKKLTNSNPINNLKKKLNQKGQVGVIIILLMVVLLTIGVSLASRSSRQQQASIEQEQATNVFNSAESAVEEALHEIFDSGESIPETGISSEGYNITPEQFLEMQVERNTSIEISLDDSINNPAYISWDKTGGTCPDFNPAAIIVMVVNESGGYNARFLAFNPETCQGERNMNLEPVGTSTVNPDYNYTEEITLRTGDVALRVMPVYSNTSLHLAGNDFETAQYSIEARAQDDTDTAKAIDVTRTMSAAPTFMDFAVVSSRSTLEINN